MPENIPKEVMREIPGSIERNGETLTRYNNDIYCKYKELMVFSKTT